jgi:hypothetical protein
MMVLETEFETGAMVYMRNDMDKNPGIVVGYKYIDGGTIEYLVSWGPALSDWHTVVELALAPDPPKSEPFHT